MAVIEEKEEGNGGKEEREVRRKGGEDGEGRAVEVGFFQVDGGDLVVVVASIIANALFEVVTTGIDGDFVTTVAEVADAALLVDGVEDVEELAHAGHLVIVAK